MKTQLIVFFILFTLGWHQCSSELILPPQGLEGLVDPRQGLLYELSNSEVDGGVPGNFAVGIPYSADNSLTRLLNNVKYYLGRSGEVLKKVVQFPFSVVSGLLAIPLGIINFLLLPVRITWGIVKFGFRLLFLPVRIMFTITKFMVYPFKLLLERLLSPPPPPPPLPPFVYGFPSYPSQGLL